MTNEDSIQLVVPLFQQAFIYHAVRDFRNYRPAANVAWSLLIACKSFAIAHGKDNNIQHRNMALCRKLTGEQNSGVEVVVTAD